MPVVGYVVAILAPAAATLSLAYASSRGRTGDVAPRRRALVLAAVATGAFAVLSVELLGALGALTAPAVTVAWLLFLTAGCAAARRRLHRDRAGGLRGTAARLHRGTAARLHRGTAARLRNAGVRLRDTTGRGERLLAVTTGGLLLVNLVVALLAEPNNYDSQTYHLPKVERWAAQGDLEFWPTAIHRQVTIPPGAEYLLLHLRLLTGGDALHNLVQWAAGVLCLLAAARIAAQLGGGRRAQLITVFLLATTPMVALQSTSTQTDLVTAAWVACVATLVLDGVRRPAGLGTVAALGAAAGLTAVTKTSGLLAVGPLLLLWLVAQLRLVPAVRAPAAGPARPTAPHRSGTRAVPRPRPARRTAAAHSGAVTPVLVGSAAASSPVAAARGGGGGAPTGAGSRTGAGPQGPTGPDTGPAPAGAGSTTARPGTATGVRRALGRTLLVVVVAALVTGPFLARVTAEFGHPLGPPRLRESVPTQRHDPAAVLVNALRIGHTALDTPLAPLRRAAAEAIIAVARVTGVDPQDRAITFGSEVFPEPAWYPDEDRVAFPLAGGLVLAAVALALARPARVGRTAPGLLRAYAVTVVLAVLLHSATIKWQTWGNRLLLYALAVAVPLAGLWLDELFRRHARRGDRPDGRRPRPVAATLAVAVLATSALSGVLAVSYGFPRRLVGSGSLLTSSDLETRFLRRPQWAEEFRWAADAVRDSGARRIGLVQQNDNWEYPWWLLLREPDGGSPQLVALQSVLPDRPPAAPSSVDAIVCTGNRRVCARLVPAGWRLEFRGYVGYALPPR